MEANLVLVPEVEGSQYGVVSPLPNGGLSVGYWNTLNGRIHITLYADVDTIVHEVATSKAINAELRAAKKDNEGEEIKPNIEYNPKTKRFKEVWPIKEK